MKCPFCQPESKDDTIGYGECNNHTFRVYWYEGIDGKFAYLCIATAEEDYSMEWNYHAKVFDLWQWSAPQHRILTIKLDSVPLVPPEEAGHLLQRLLAMKAFT